MDCQIPVIASAARLSIVEKSGFMDCRAALATTTGSLRGAQRRSNRNDGNEETYKPFSALAPAAYAQAAIE